MEKVIRAHLEPLLNESAEERRRVIQSVASRLSANAGAVECALVEAELVRPRADLDHAVDAYMKRANELLAILRPHHLQLANSRFRTRRPTYHPDWAWLRYAIQAELGIEVVREESDGPDDEPPCQHIVFGDWINIDTKQRLTREAEIRESEEEEIRAREALAAAQRAVKETEAKRARVGV